MPPTNGGHKVCFDLCEKLSEVEEIVAVSSDNNELTEELTYPFYGLFKDEKWKYIDPRFAYRLWDICKKENVTTIFLQQPYMMPFVWAVGKLLGIRTLLYAHNLEYKRWETIGKWWSPLMYFWEKVMFQLADHSLFISESEMEEGEQVFQLKPSEVTFLPHMIDQESSPMKDELAKKELKMSLGLSEDTFLLLYYAAFSYQPNAEGLAFVQNELLPYMERNADFPFHIIVCGGGVEGELKTSSSSYYQYLGFVDDLQKHILGADVVLNPIYSGGGVKTKAIEAIGLGKTVVSFATGAEGIAVADCGEKLLISKDNQVEEFYQNLIRVKTQGDLPTPKTFYDRYYWKNVIKTLQGVVKK